MDVAITDVVDDALSITVLSGTMTIGDGGLTIWCDGARHTWQGELTYAGYIFASDASDPLQFMLDEAQGYIYVAGRGSVTSPDGTIARFPE